MPEIELFPNAQELSKNAAARFISMASESILSQGFFTIALSGGSTPLKLYSLLSEEAYSMQIDWAKVHLFWGDERCVPANHPDSNYYSVKLALLDRIPLPIPNIHGMPGELEPNQAALIYEAELKAFFGSQGIPSFDLVLLGLGEDGHTASLFPGSPALLVRNQWVVSVEHSTPPPPLIPRLTLTLPVLNAAKQVFFLVSGKGKAEILSQVFTKSEGFALLPAQRINPVNGKLSWLVDQEAASSLDLIKTGLPLLPQMRNHFP